MCSVCKEMKKKQKKKRAPNPSQHVLQGPHRLPNNLLGNFPVDLLAVERGSATKPLTNYKCHSWENVTSCTNINDQPQVVIGTCPPNLQLWTKGPACESPTEWWGAMNYVSRLKWVSATNVGGDVSQSHLIVTQVKQEWSHLWIWNAEETKVNTTPRPMSNLLTPPGLIRAHKCVNGRTRDLTAHIHPMPSVMGAYIQTECGRQRLLPEETGRTLGIPKELRISPKQITTKGLLSQTTSLFHWEYLSPTLSRASHLSTSNSQPPSPIYDLEQDEQQYLTGCGYRAGTEPTWTVTVSPLSFRLFRT
jgi:hypothetical protein